MVRDEATRSTAPNADLVSIVLPTHNGARFLGQAIESCLQQTHANLELIVVIDGSDDSTDQIMQAIADPRVKIFRHRRNHGLPAALNSGFAESRGNYLTWTSDDNRYHPHAIENMLALLSQHAEVAFVYADFHRIDESGVNVEEVRLGPPQELLERNCVGPCFLYRREVYVAVGEYNPAARLAEDLEYWLRVYRHFKMARLPEDLYAYAVHPGSLTGSGYNRYEALRVAARARRRVLGLSWRRYVAQMAQADVEEGFARFALGDLGGAQATFWRAICYNPSWLANRGIRAILVRAMSLPWRAAKQPKHGPS